MLPTTHVACTVDTTATPREGRTMKFLKNAGLIILILALCVLLSELGLW